MELKQCTTDASSNNGCHADLAALKWGGINHTWVPVGDVVVLARVVGNVVQASCLERVAVCGGVAGFGQTVDDIRPGRWRRRVVVCIHRGNKGMCIGLSFLIRSP